VTPCLIFALRGNTLMANVPRDQIGQGSAVERCIHHTAAQYAASQSHAAAVWKVRPFGASSLPILERGSTLGPACRGRRGYSADHPEGTSADSTSPPGLCEKHWAEHRDHRDTGIGPISEDAEKTWLSRAQCPACFKFTLNICLTACTIQSSPKPTVFLCPFGNAPSAAR